jgi:hypothetical protein
MFYDYQQSVATLASQVLLALLDDRVDAYGDTQVASPISTSATSPTHSNGEVAWSHQRQAHSTASTASDR